MELQRINPGPPLNPNPPQANPAPQPNPPPPPYVPRGERQIKGVSILNNFFYPATKVVTIAILVLLAATIVLLALATAQKMHPLAALYAFAGFGGSLIVLAILHCAQKAVADHYGVPHDRWEKTKYPPAAAKTT